MFKKMQKEQKKQLKEAEKQLDFPDPTVRHMQTSALSKGSKKTKGMKSRAKKYSGTKL